MALTGLLNDTIANIFYNVKGLKDLKQAKSNLDGLNKSNERLAKNASGVKGFFSTLSSSIKNVNPELATFGGLAAGAFFTGRWLGSVDEATVKLNDLSVATGASVDTLGALTNASAGLGFDIDHIADIFEELNNKVGELERLPFKDVTSEMKEALAGLNIDPRTLKSLGSVDDQIKLIFNRLKDVKDDQQALSIADQFLGGEANRVIAMFRSTGLSLDQLITKYKQFNLRTEEGRKGNRAFAKQVKNTNTLFGSFFDEIRGLVQGALAPLINNFNFLASNKFPTVS